MSQWLMRNRLLLFALLNISALIIVPACAAVHGIALGRAAYVCVLIAICTTPFALMTSFAGRFTLLQIFAGLYFLDFGGRDLQVILTGVGLILERPAFFTPAEVAVLAGALLLGVGYFAGLRLAGGARIQPVRAEWPQATALLVGLAAWLVGSALSVYLNVFVAPDKSNLTFQQGFASLGALGTFLVQLGTLVQPLGLVILAYGYAKYRGPVWTALIIAVIIAQAAIGFVTDVKATAMMGVLVVVVIRVLVDNRLSLPWLISGLVFLLVSFPVYQAYRTEITGVRGLNRLQAFNEFGKVLEIAWSSRDDVDTLRPEERAPPFLERADIKGNLEQVVAHLGVDVPYLQGESFVEVPLAFVPRLIIGDKKSVSVAQLYNHQIGKSQDDTFISISHMGEMYYNFGWLGILCGMPLEGLLLGFVAARFNLEQGASLTRVMILLTTVLNFCIYFEGQLPLCIVVWLRSMAAIGLLHMLFARRDAPRLQQEAAPANSDSAAAKSVTAWAPGALARAVPAQSLPRFPNVLR